MGCLSNEIWEMDLGLWREMKWLLTLVMAQSIFAANGMVSSQYIAFS
jgi:hypothetical protein